MIHTETICQVITCEAGCTPQTGCLGMAWGRLAPSYYQQMLERLVGDAARDGLVLTIEQRSLPPLAMGNYESVVNVRPARGRA